MGDCYVTAEQIDAYGCWLEQREQSRGTIEKYLRDLRSFACWLKERGIPEEKSAAAWKEYLLAEHYAPVTINSMLAALNGFFRFAGREGIRVKYLKIQRQAFRNPGRELSRADYRRLVSAARNRGKERLALVMETMAGAGIRVSEVRCITVEAARRGRTEIYLKNKIRSVLLAPKLCRKLLKYAGKQKIASGEIFLTRGGKELSRKQIWAEMKGLCRAAGVKPERVFPHNLRHLFAVSFYGFCKDIVKLADVLGHSSIETTRMYLLTSGAEHARYLERLELIS